MARARITIHPRIDDSWIDRAVFGSAVWWCAELHGNRRYGFARSYARALAKARRAAHDLVDLPPARWDDYVEEV